MGSIMWSSEIKKKNINTIYLQIVNTTLKDKVISLKKLRAFAAIELGTSTGKFNEYIEALVDSDKIKIDNDEVWAIDEKGEVYTAKSEADKIMNEKI